MSAYTLTKTRFREGVWTGLLVAKQADAAPPEINVTLRDQSVKGVTVTATAEAGRYAVEIPVPIEALGDGVQTFLICDANADVVLESFTLMAGEALGEDIRAEVELLRAELDMLKRAFRRHCLETM
ncbi:hypothetical protein [Tropicibacter naphthalenivorans]|uniref:Uncharacterized protein n=1 Tax=Tropicibacter naphthalenivorans TaxID=441103 RepID=A0A0N7LZZ1_9RHOB|nr:hypothetical protein [Tropicibacter naphthalenivorans]CUH79009.1 hypothetical protein TRN7648_02277 [Tropicibacter naphthalenivorans]SMD03937.1 hypothetical protein SAMN04488093_11197 [Tropicibacter naphthalenivorans]